MIIIFDSTDITYLFCKNKLFFQKWVTMFEFVLNLHELFKNSNAPGNILHPQLAAPDDPVPSFGTRALVILKQHPLMHLQGVSLQMD